MPNHTKTIPEMEAEIRQLQQTLALPGIPDDERAIHLNTIQRIRDIIARQQRPEMQNTPPEPPPVKQPDPRQYPVTPMRVIKAGPRPQTGDPGGGVIIDLKNKPATIDHSTRLSMSDERIQPIRGNETITAHLDATPPTVTIEWPDEWGTKTYRESEIRGRFSSALRDLSKSSYARRERFDMLPHYLTWWRAKTWYRALCHFWPHPPSLNDLGITRTSYMYRNIFYLIAS